MFTDLIKDLNDTDLPRDIDTAYDKLKCPLVFGGRVYWYYSDDLEFWKREGFIEEEGFNPKNWGVHSGVVITKPDVELGGGELDADDCIIVIDEYPVEKCYPECTYIAVKRLIDSDDLVEIIA